MSDVESEQSQNDIEIEISDLDEPGVSGNSTKPIPLSARPRSSHRQRSLQLTITAVIVILTVMLILATTAPVRELVRGVFIRPIPTPVPTLAPGVDLFYVRGDPPWGHLSIDGQAVSRLPRISVDPPVRLSRGQHVLVWGAEPFQEQSCTVSVPARYGTDTCHYNETVQLNSELSAWLITFTESLTTLPNDKRTTLIQAAQAAIDAQSLTGTVHSGELYVLPPQNPACKPAPGVPLCYATAKQPLKATLSFQLDTDAVANALCAGPQPSCTFLYQNCHLFCTGSALVSSTTREWDVFAPVHSLWEFTTFDGQVLERDVPDNSLWDNATGQINDESLVQLRIMWDTLGWHVDVPFDESVQNTFLNPACGATQQETGLLEPPADTNGPIYLQWQYVSGTLSVAGCLAVGTPRHDAGITPKPTHSPPFVAYCLHRFGVLLAANDVAHRSWPYLPLADANEQHLSQQLAALIPGSSS